MTKREQTIEAVKRAIPLARESISRDLVVQAIDRLPFGTFADEVRP